MGKSTIKKNYIFNLTYQLLLILIPIITIPYLSRILLEDGVGIFSYSESIVSYFVLFAVLGSTTYAQREIGKVQNMVSERTQVFWEIFILRLIMSVLSIMIYGVYLIFCKEYFIISLIFGLNILNVICDITWFYQGIEEFGKVVVFGLVFKLLEFAFIFLFVKTQEDLWLYVLGKCGFLIIGNLCLWIFLPKYLCKVKQINPFRHIKTIITFFIPTIAVQVYTMLDKSMIGWFTNSTAENGYYEYAEKIVRMSITVISALSVVLVPRVSKAFSEKDNETIFKIINNAVSYVWMIGIPLLFGMIAVSDIFVPIYLGENFLKSALLLKIFTPLILFVGMANIIGVAYLVPINKQKVYIVATIVASVVNVILNCILIPVYYSVGAAISSVIAEGVGIIIQCTYVFKKNLFSIKSFFLVSIKKWLSGIIMFIVLLVIKSFLPFKIWSIIVLVVTGIIVYFASLLLLRDKFLYEAVKKVIQNIKQKKKKLPDEDNR